VAKETGPNKKHKPRQQPWLDAHTLNQHDDYREAVARYRAGQHPATASSAGRTPPDAHLTTR